MKRLLLAALLLCSAAAYAQEGKETSPEGGSGFPAADEPIEHGPVIENWWSWDYGDHPKDPTHKGLPPPFGYALINFAIFFGIMYRLAAKPLKTFIADRHDRIAKDLDEAARLRQQAEAQLKEYERKVQNVDAEVDQLLKQINAEAEAEKARIIAAAEAQARKLKEDAQRQIEAEIARARGELRLAVVDAAVGAAENLVKTQIASDDQRKMAEKYVAELEHSAPKPGRA
jgi:ATP synthase F0 subunit b